MSFRSHREVNQPDGPGRRQLACLPHSPAVFRTGVAVATDDLAVAQDNEVDAIPGHGDSFETAMMLALRPEMVRTEAMRHGAPDAGKKGIYFTKRLRREPLVHLPQQAGLVTPDGWGADPTKGTLEKGERYVELIVNRLAEFIREFAAGTPVPAIYTFDFATEAAKTKARR